jgi:class 3 adenylate cyclase
MTDESHARAQARIQNEALRGREAEACFDREAEEVLATVNLYLGAIADVVKQHDGTLDKYIGDCVMAFWGAPTPNPQHARACVRAAIDAQRAVHTLNLRRVAENGRRQRENTARAARGEPPLPLLKILSMGTGINTGIVSIGLMGSERHISNYTVFGLDVNLAARLEGHSGRGRILIGEATYGALLREDADLAAACIPHPPAQFKGIRHPVAVFEVPWQAPVAEAGGASLPAA